jgi:EAL domain-containing protein (putative c-di-GMP-specific phosphodiesterase class I)
VIRSIDMLGHFDIDPEIDANLFRFEGGVFSLLLHRVRSERSAALVAERILEAIRQPFVLEDTETYITASIGIATYPAERVETVALLRLASSARDYAKNRGGDAFQFSSGDINTQYQKRLCLEAKLRKSISREELVLHYQPKVDVQTGAVMGVEALLRWNNGEDGLIFPDKFISIAEEIGLIIPIGEWVLSTACLQLKNWQQAARTAIGMSVNLSSLHFQEQQLPAVVKRIVDHSGLDPQLLTLEVTESMLLEDIDNKIDLMHHLKDIGVKLSIDDFGTGYSSLNYLRRLPLDELKIDRSFVTDLAQDSNSRALFSSVVFLSHNLGLLTVAEGIETEAQLHFLQQHRCDQYQGYFFSPPLSNTEVLDLLSQQAGVDT